MSSSGCPWYQQLINMAKPSYLHSIQVGVKVTLGIWYEKCIWLSVIHTDGYELDLTSVGVFCGAFQSEISLLFHVFWLSGLICKVCLMLDFLGHTRRPIFQRSLAECEYPSAFHFKTPFCLHIYICCCRHKDLKHRGYPILREFILTMG